MSVVKTCVREERRSWLSERNGKQTKNYLTERDGLTG